MDVQDKIFAIADKITKYNFREIWGIERQAMGRLEKEEVAEEMFFKGIAYILDHLNNLEEIDIDRIKKKIMEIS
ncbi:MAG: hypothetical protein KAK00_09465 [Nanoarchaeota archaeon]|nr:hypothetical protein [Nanoarchaeota archaeon]